MKDEIRKINPINLIFKADRVDKGNIEALAKSIESYGLRQPPLVVQNDSKFEIIDGRRRFEACKKIGLKEIPCVVVSKKDANEDLSLILNTHRLNLNPVELYNIAMRYVKDELKLGDVMKVPPEKVRSIAAKLNLDVNATLRILSIGRLKKEVRSLIVAGSIPLRLALPTVHIKDPKLLVHYCKWCVNTRPSTREAINWIERYVDRKNRPYKHLENAIFSKSGCAKCRYRGRHDVSLFEDPTTKDDHDNDYCWNPECYNSKTDAVWNHVMKIAKEKHGLTGVKRAPDEVHYWSYARYTSLKKKDPKFCKKCKQVLLISYYDRPPIISCPTSCANIQQSKLGCVVSKPAIPRLADMPKAKHSEKVQYMELRFAVAVRKVMLETFIASLTQSKGATAKFEKGKEPKDYARILFFVGKEGTNPFGAFMHYRWEPLKKQKLMDQTLKMINLKHVAGMNMTAAARHLKTYDSTGTEPKEIDKAIELLYGEKKWCKRNYSRIVNRLSKSSKKIYTELKDWKPSWVK